VYAKLNKSVRLFTVAINVTLLAFAAERRAAAPLSIYISCWHGAHQQTRRTPWAAGE